MDLLLDNEIGDLSTVLLRLSMARGIEDITAVVRRSVRQLLGADGATFVLKDGDRCFYVDEEAISPLWKGQRFPMDACISGWVMTHGRAAAIPNIYRDSRIPADIYRLTFVRSLLMVPVGQNEPVAAIGAYWAKERRFTAQEMAVLTTIANAASGALVNVSLFNSLITAAKQAAEKTAAAERANTAKTRFLAAASHDLRQPFQAMRLYLEVLSMKLPGNDPVITTSLAGLSKSMAAGEQLLGAILDMSTLDAGIVRAHRETFPVSEVVAAVVAECEVAAEAKGLRLRAVPCSQLVDSDPKLLTRMLRHLIHNALRYTPKGGVVVGCRNHGDHLSLEVWDSGIGIAEDQLGLVFDEFYQVGNAERDREQGLGIGLSAVSRMGQLLDHAIDVRSHLARGSVFSISLPLARISHGLAQRDRARGEVRRQARP
jgi:signal transduction histidine kinase